MLRAACPPRTRSATQRKRGRSTPIRAQLLPWSIASAVRVESVVQGRRAGVGSGVIIAGDGLVLTNSHVIGGAKRVRLSIAMGGEAEAQLLGDDPDTDLALLRSELPSDTPAAALGDS
jgi:S1-C subfamily serine protease